MLTTDGTNLIALSSNTMGQLILNGTTI